MPGPAKGSSVRRAWLIPALLLLAACASDRAPVGERAWFVFSGPEGSLRVDLAAEGSGYRMQVEGRAPTLLEGDLGAGREGGDPVPLPLWLRPERREVGAETAGGRVTGRTDLGGRQVLAVDGPPGLRRYYHPLTGFLVGWERDGRRFRLEKSSATQF